MKKFIETCGYCFVAFSIMFTSWKILITAVDWAVEKIFDRDHDDDETETKKEKKERKKYITIR